MLVGRTIDQLVDGCDPPHDLGVWSPRLYAGVSARLNPGVHGLFFSGFTATAAACLNACSTSAASMARFSLPADRSDFPLSLPESAGEPSGERLAILARSPPRAATFFALRLSPAVGGTPAATRAGPVFSVSAAIAAEPIPAGEHATPAVTPRDGPLGGIPCLVTWAGGTHWDPAAAAAAPPPAPGGIGHDNGPCAESIWVDCDTVSECLLLVSDAARPTIPWPKAPPSELPPQDCSESWSSECLSSNDMAGRAGARVPRSPFYPHRKPAGRLAYG